MRFFSENIPSVLKDQKQWALWRKENREDGPAKVPYQPDGKRARSNDPKTWCSFNVALTTFQDVGGFDGICWMMPKVPEDIIFIDIDHCIKDNVIEPWALEIIEQFNSYTEKSQSGNGIHILVKGKKPIKRCRIAGSPYEIYDCLRPCYLTGDVVNGQKTIEARQDQLNRLFNDIFPNENSTADGFYGSEKGAAPGTSRLMDAEIIQRAILAKNGNEFKSLWDGSTLGYNGDDSAADMALMNMLAFWTGGDTAQMERLFSRSGLGRRDKWRDRADYRERTIRKAISEAREFYEPPKSKSNGGFSDVATIRAVTLDHPVGSVGVDRRDGCIKKVELTKDGQKVLKWLSDCALYIHMETTAQDATEFNFRGVGAKDKRSISFTLPATALADPRKFRAATINAFGANNRVGSLDFETVQLLTESTVHMKRVEVPGWCGNIPLLPGVGMADNVEYQLSTKIPAAVYDGDLQKAKETLRKLLKVHKFSPLLITGVLGSPAIARWRKNDRFGIGLWGTTGTLKTSTALAAMGMYGTGYMDAPKLKAGKGGSTIVGALEIFAAAGFLPQIYDDVKTVGTKDSENYVATIHAVLEGEEKARGKKDGGLRDSREFTCMPIITGEVRPQEASTSARVLNLNWARADGKLLSEVQRNAALLPVIGYHWLRFLASTDLVLGKEFDAIRSKKVEELLGLKYTNPGRLATIYTLLVGVWELLEASPFGEVFVEYRGDFMEALHEAIAAQGVMVTEETEIERFLAGLEEIIASNPGIVMSVDGKKCIAGSVIGKWMPDGIFLLPTETLNELSKIKAFSQQPTVDSITLGLNETGLLIPDPDGKHLKYRLRFNGGRPRGWYIKTSVPQNYPPKQGGGDSSGDTKINSCGLNVPIGPTVPPENERETQSEVFQKNHDRLSDKNKNHKNIKEILQEENVNHQNGGDIGDIGDSNIVNSIVDIDFDSNVSVPDSGPKVPKHKTTELEDADNSDTDSSLGVDSSIEVSTNNPAYGPNPRKDDPGLANFKAAMKKRKCILCGRTFPYDLGIFYLDGRICQACHAGHGGASR